MATRAKKNIIGVLFIISVVSIAMAPPVGAQCNEVAGALDIIAEFADRFCKEVPLQGNTVNTTISGEVRADLQNVLRRIIDLGVAGNVIRENSEYEGVLQKDLLPLLLDQGRCRSEVWRVLSAKLINSQYLPTAPKIEIASPRSDEKVPHECHFQGSYEEGCGNRDFWLVIQPLESPFFHPTTGPVVKIHNQGKWKGIAYIDESQEKDHGKHFVVHVVRTTPQVSRKFHEYLEGAAAQGWPGLRELPSGAIPIASVNVIRN
jgi:hypothetical protein